MKYKTRLYLVTALLVGLVILTSVGYSQQPQSSRRIQTTAKLAKPNFVLINLDDADADLFSESMLALYPSIQRLATGGIRFTNLHVTTPFCGPSRASLFRGQYAHRSGVRVNIPQSPLSLGFRGGYSEFLRRGHDQDELGVWMKQAGYRTMMIGKYHHNGFDFRRPEGWDDFYASNGGRYVQTYRFTTRDDPEGKKVRPSSDIYRTDQEANDAVDLIRRHQDKPYFLYVAPLAPHRPVGPDFTKMVDKKKYENWMPELSIPDAPDLNEADVGDKPASRQSRPLTSDQMLVFEDEFRCRARAVKSVDDMVRRILEALEETEQLDRTYIFFTSDNGYELGHHRQHNKLDPYERCTRVPLYVCGPGIAQGQSANHLLAHFDMGATILELAGGRLPESCDAKSFAPLLTEANLHDPARWREYVVIENWQSKQNPYGLIPGTYSGLRFYDQTYVEWATGEKSYYNLASDPFQLENVYPRLSDQRKNELKLTLLNSRRESMKPLVTIVDPTSTTGLPRPGQVSIEGVAEDDRIVKQVRLTIQNKSTQQFWDGDRWQSTKMELNANQSADDQQIVFWSYPIADLIETCDQTTELQLSAVAVDADDQRSEPAIVAERTVKPRE